MTSYDADYFLRGKEKGLSLYSDYRWLPDLTIPMARRMAEFLGITKENMVQDFGCARGYLVKAFREIGIPAIGYDASQWAIDNCDESVKDAVIFSDKVMFNSDWIIAKDTLEHLNNWAVTEALLNFSDRARTGVFVVVPLSHALSDPYVVQDYENDVTHIIRWPLWRWVQEFHTTFDETWEISARYRVEGIKDNYASWTRGNGFITARKISPHPSPS